MVTDQVFANSTNKETSVSAPSRPRESLDGETIFAVGDDVGGFSDSDDDDENKKLTRKISAP